MDIEGQNELLIVLILVFVELTFWDSSWPIPLGVSSARVLILVFVELTFWDEEIRQELNQQAVLILVFVELTFWAFFFLNLEWLSGWVLILVFVELTFWGVFDNTLSHSFAS